MGVMVFNATFNNISVISLRSVLLVVEEIGVPGENHRTAPSHRQTLSHKQDLNSTFNAKHKHKCHSQCLCHFVDMRLRDVEQQ